MSRSSQSERGLARVRGCQCSILMLTQKAWVLRSTFSTRGMNGRRPFTWGWFRSYHSLIDQIHWWAKEFFNYRPPWCIELILLVHGGNLISNEWQNIQSLLCGHSQTWAHCCCYCSINTTLAANVVNYCPSCICQALCHGCISSGSIDLSLALIKRIFIILFHLLSIFMRENLVGIIFPLFFFAFFMRWFREEELSSPPQTRGRPWVLA